MVQATLSGAERLPLEALEVGDAELGDELGVLPEGAGLAGPARLGREVERRVQRGADPDGDVLLPGDVGELAHGVGVAQRGESERLGPLRERLGRERGAGVLDERVPRVGRDRHRDAVRRPLGERLQVVVPAGRHPGVVEHVHVEVGEVLLEHHVARRRLADRARALDDRAVGARLDDGLEHQTDLLLEGQPAEQVVDPRLDVEPGVLEGVHPAVAVEVAVPTPSSLVARPAHAGPSVVVSCTLRRGRPWSRAAGSVGCTAARVAVRRVTRRRARRRTPRCR